MEVAEIMNLEPEAYLNPSLFITDDKSEKDEVFLRRQFEIGFTHSSKHHTVGIMYNGSWFSTSSGVYNITGHVVGRNPGTASLLRGLLRGPARFVVYRLHGAHPGQKLTTIKEVGEHLVVEKDVSDVSEVDEYNGIQIYRGAYKNIVHYFFCRNGRKRFFSSMEYTKQMIKYMEEKNDIF